jgi:hypothetical protein
LLATLSLPLEVEDVASPPTDLFYSKNLPSSGERSIHQAYSRSAHPAGAQHPAPAQSTATKRTRRQAQSIDIAFPASLQEGTRGFAKALRYVAAARWAKQLLENSYLEVKEVTAVIGVNDVSHFVRNYKAIYHQTPSQTRALAPNASVENLGVAASAKK